MPCVSAAKIEDGAPRSVQQILGRPMVCGAHPALGEGHVLGELPVEEVGVPSSWARPLVESVPRERIGRVWSTRAGSGGTPATPDDVGGGDPPSPRPSTWVHVNRAGRRWGGDGVLAVAGLVDGVGVELHLGSRSGRRRSARSRWWAGMAARSPRAPSRRLAPPATLSTMAAGSWPLPRPRKPKLSGITARPPAAMMARLAGPAQLMSEVRAHGSAPRWS